MRKKDPICPLLRKPCVGADCMWWTHITGVNPQNGAAVDHFDCSIKWIPVMMIEASKQTRGVQASVESMRNETVKNQEELNAHMAQVSKAIPVIQMVDAIARQQISAPTKPAWQALDHTPEG